MGEKRRNKDKKTRYMFQNAEKPAQVAACLKSRGASDFGSEPVKPSRNVKNVLLKLRER